MADKRKVYTITINGLKESVDLVKSLNSELTDLDSSLRKLKSQKINIEAKVDVDDTKTKKIVSGNEGELPVSMQLSAREKELEIQKQLKSEVKATAQAQAAVTDEYKRSLAETIKAKDEVKSVKQEITDMFNGAKDGAGRYTNTLAGLRAELRDLVKEQKSLEIGSDAYNELDNRILAVTSNLKALEQAHGDFRRNVGNYPTAEVEAFRAKFEELYTEMMNLVKESNDLHKVLNGVEVGSELYNAIKKDIDEVDAKLKKAKQDVDSFNASLSKTPKFEVKVGDATREFSSIREAVKSLTADLTRMTAEGKNNTKEFNDTIVALGRLKTSIKDVSDEAQSYVGNAKALSDTLEIMRGVTGIASIGQGLSMLFGGENKDLDEAIKKFTALSLIMQGIEEQARAMNYKNSIWGKTLKWVWNWLEKIGNFKFNGSESLNDTIDKFDRWANTLKEINKWKTGKIEKDELEGLDNQINKVSKDFSDFTDDAKASWKRFRDSIEDIKFTINTDDVQKQLDSVAKQIEITQKDIETFEGFKLDIETGKVEGDIDEINGMIEFLKKNLKDLNNEKITIESADITNEVQASLRYLDEFDRKLADMEGEGIDVEGVKKLSTEWRRVVSSVQYANSNLAKTPAILKAIGVAGEAAAKGLKFATAALKGFLKATVILGLIQIAMEVVMWIIEKLRDAVVGLWDAMRSKGGLEMEKRLDMIGDSADRTRDKLSKLSDELERMSKLGKITELEKAKKELENYQNAAMDAAKGLQDFIAAQTEAGNLKPAALLNNLNNSAEFSTKRVSFILGDAADIKNLDEFKEHYKALEKAAQNGTDVIEAGWKRGSGALLTADDAVEQLGDDTKAVLNDMALKVNQINVDISHINFDKPEEAAEELTKSIEQMRKITDNELYQSAIANLDKLLPEEEWAQGLSRIYKTFESMVDNANDKAKDLAVAIAAANKEMAKQTELSNINAIPDAKKRQAALDAYNKKQRQEEINNSLADAKHKREALEALDKEYDQIARDRAKDASSNARTDAEEGLKALRDIRIELMRDGLDKEIALLEAKMSDEIKAAEKYGKRRGEVILAIQEKYNYLIQKKREEWYKKHKKAVDEFNREMLERQRQAAEELAEVQNVANINNVQRNLDLNENIHQEERRTISYDFDYDIDKSLQQNNELLQRQKQYHAEMLAEDAAYLNEKRELELEEAKQTTKMQLAEEKSRWERSIDEASTAEARKIEEIAELYEQGVVSYEEWAKMKQDIETNYQSLMQDLTYAHEKKLEEIEKNGQQDLLNIEANYITERQQAQDDANRKLISSIQSAYDEISYISEEQQKRNTNRKTGIFDIGKERKRLKEVSYAYEKTMAEIDDAYEELKRQLNDGDIDFNQFEEAKKQLDNLKKNAVKAQEDTQYALKDLFENWASNVNSTAQEIADAFNDLYGRLNDIMNLKYDMEEEALNREQEQLDRENDIVEKAYDKQAEIVERYKDRINETEDELKDARGERRLALIDGLAQQREEYLKETEALQKQQQEKEKIAKKEEALQKQQDALEKKRKMLQKQQSIVNATINTALGVTQALSAYPPPASYALAAAVGALGAVQIGLIASQKYAQGGELDGPSHQYGGIKVPTKHGLSEVEGGEFITNRKTTKANTELLYFVNSIRRKVTIDDMEEFFGGKKKVRIPAQTASKYAQGGTLPDVADFNLKQQISPVYQEAEKTYVVQVVDIANALDGYENVRTLAGLE